MSTTSGAIEQGQVRCSYVLERKRRTCRMTVRAGELYCAAHTVSNTVCRECGTRVSVNGERKHLEKCPTVRRRRELQAQPYYRAGANVREQEEEEEEEEEKEMEIEGVELLLDRLFEVKEVKESCEVKEVGKVIEDLEAFCGSEVEKVRCVWSDPCNSSFRLETKHFNQFINLCKLAYHHFTSTITTTTTTTTSSSSSSSSSVPTATTTASSPSSSLPSTSTPIFLTEFGAGRGYTSLFMAHLLTELGHYGTNVLLVDRYSSRHRADKAFRSEFLDTGLISTFTRVNIDIRDLHLPPLLPSSSSRHIFCGKHLCGACLDVSLTAITHYVISNTNVECTLVFASCCRRLCSFDAFGDHSAVWRDVLQCGRAEVRKVCACANWGLDSHGTAQNKDMEKVERMGGIGKKCRQLVDTVRVLWLRSKGWSAYLCNYTDESPESTCIVATWTSTSTHST